MLKNYGCRGRWGLFVSSLALSAMLIIAPHTNKVQAQGTLKVGMTLADIPVSFGQPDQGFEGFTKEEVNEHRKTKFLKIGRN